MNLFFDLPLELQEYILNLMIHHQQYFIYEKLYKYNLQIRKILYKRIDRYIKPKGINGM